MNPGRPRSGSFALHQRQVAVMKTSQMVLAMVALMVMIAAITYAMQFLGGVSSPPATPEEVEAKPAVARVERDLPQLFFETTEYPFLKQAVLPWEMKHPGHRDFW